MNKMYHTNLANSENCLRLGPSPIGGRKQYMGKDVFDSIALHLKCEPIAEHLLNETRTHLETQYKEVYDGSRNELLTFPTHYEFGVETKKNDKSTKAEWARQCSRTMQYVDESLIKARIQHLDRIPNQSWEDIREKSHLESLLKLKLPLSTEAKVIMRFRTFFANHRGLLLHSYKPETYLLT